MKVAYVVIGGFMLNDMQFRQGSCYKEGDAEYDLICKRVKPISDTYDVGVKVLVCEEEALEAELEKLPTKAKPAKDFFSSVKNMFGRQDKEDKPTVRNKIVVENGQAKASVNLPKPSESAPEPVLEEVVVEVPEVVAEPIVEPVVEAVAEPVEQPVEQPEPAKRGRKAK